MNQPTKPDSIEFLPLPEPVDARCQRIGHNGKVIMLGDEYSSWEKYKPSFAAEAQGARGFIPRDDMVNWQYLFTTKQMRAHAKAHVLADRAHRPAVAPVNCECGKCEWRDFYTGPTPTHHICASCGFKVARTTVAPVVAEGLTSPLQFTVKDENQVWLTFKGGMVCLNTIAEERGPVTRRAMQAALSDFLAAHPVAGSPVKIPGLGRMTDEDSGFMTLQFVDDDAAQAFMQSYEPSVDAKEMERIDRILAERAASATGSPAEAMVVPHAMTYPEPATDAGAGYTNGWNDCRATMLGEVMDDPTNHPAEPMPASEIEATYAMRTRTLDSVGRVNGDWSDWTPCTAEQYRVGGNLIGIEREFSATSMPAAAPVPASEAAKQPPVMYQNRLIAPNGNPGRWVECDLERYKLFSNRDAGDGFKYEVRALCVASPTAPTDDQIISAVYPHMMKADGGYACDTAPEHVVAGVRAAMEVTAAPTDAKLDGSLIGEGTKIAAQSVREADQPAKVMLRDALEAWFEKHDDSNKCCHAAFTDGYNAALSAPPTNERS